MDPRASHRCLSIRARVLFPVLALALALGAMAQTEPPPPSKEAEAKRRLISRIPLGVPIRRFRLPQFETDPSATGQRLIASIIEVGQLRRVSDQRFALENVKIRLFEGGNEVRTIITPHARFHLEHQLLAGNHPVRIERPDSEVPEATGRGFIYHLESKVWSLLSEVTTRFARPQSEADQIENPPAASEKP